MRPLHDRNLRGTRRLGLTALAALIVPLVAASASAQASTARGAVAPFSSVYVATGSLLMDVSKLNARFERSDLPAAQRPGFYTISNDAYSVGLGGYGVVLNRMLIGGEWHSADLGEEANPSGKTNQLQTTYFMGTLGYPAFTGWRITVFGFLGVGYGSLKLTLKNRDGGPTVPNDRDPTFDEILASPGSRSDISGNYVMVQPGLGIDFLVLGDEDAARGLTLGLRVGSAISPNRTKWKYGGRDVFGGPDAGPTAGTLRVQAGYGGFRLGGGPGR